MEIGPLYTFQWVGSRSWDPNPAHTHILKESDQPKTWGGGVNLPSCTACSSPGPNQDKISPATLSPSGSPWPQTSLLRVSGVLAAEEVLRIRDRHLELPAQAHGGWSPNSREKPCLQGA